jgi:hypothetical protein
MNRNMSSSNGFRSGTAFPDTGTGSRCLAAAGIANVAIAALKNARLFSMAALPDCSGHVSEEEAARKRIFEGVHGH